LLIPVGFAIYLYILGATNGMLAERYKEPGYSGRDRLAQASIHLFLEHPIIGVGTSNFNALIAEEKLYNFTSGAHNEITRAMAEHGILGILFFWGFFAVLTIEILKRSKLQRDFAIYFLLFFVLTIVHNGLKTGLQSFILLLAVALPTVANTSRKKGAMQLAAPGHAGT
jgi:O-antigen ligase